MRAVFAFLAVLLLAPGAAWADGYAVRATPTGLSWVASAARERIPTELDLPPFEKELYDCPGTSEDIFARAYDAVGEVRLRSLDLVPERGALQIRVVLDLDLSAIIEIDNAYACFGHALCETRIEADYVDVTVDVGLHTSPHGTIELTHVDVQVDLPPEDFELDSDGCFAGDAAERAVELVEGWALGKIIPRLETFAEEAVLGAVHEAIDDLGVQTVEKNGFRLRGWLEGVDVAPGVGLTLRADASVEWMADARTEADQAALPHMPGPTAEPLPEDVPGSFHLAASDQRVTEALFEAWRSGLFDLLYERVAGDGIELSQDGVAQKLGLPAGTRVRPSFQIGAPPRLYFGRTDPGHILIDLRQARLHLALTSPGSPAGMVEVGLDATLIATASVEPERGLLRISPRDLAVRRLDLITASERIRPDTARITEFIRAVVLPLLGERLEAVPIALAVRPTPELFVLTRAVEASDGWLRVGVDVFRPDSSDAAEPDTRFVDPAAAVGPAMAAFQVTGSDDTTPASLLQYEVLLDGEPVGEPSFLSEVRISAADGEHTLEVRAIDVHGRTDPTPAAHSFVVDGVPPTLEVLERPASLIESDAAFARWTVSDDRAGVETRWELRALGPEDGRGTVVAEEAFAAGRDQVSLTHLDRGGLYVLEIVARDAVGNVTSEEIGFSTLQDNGCSVGRALGSSGTVPFPTLLLGLILGLVLLRRAGPRRPRLGRGGRATMVALLLVGVAAAPARAQMGTPLSGVTVGDGAAPYWNPAAMNRVEGTRLEAAGSLGSVRIAYRPEGSEGSSTALLKPGATLGVVSDALGERWRFGLTAGILDAAGTKWARDGGAAAITRYYAVDARTFFLGAIPALSVRLAPWISIGVGVKVARGQIDAKLDKDMGAKLNVTAGSPDPDAPFPYAHPDLAAPVDLSAQGWGVGGVFGVNVMPHETLHLGLSLHTRTRVGSDGRIDVVYPDRLLAVVDDVAPAAELPEISGDLEVPLALPLRVIAGAAWEPAEDWELRLDYRYAHTSPTRGLDFIVSEATSEDLNSTFIVKDYRNTHGVYPRILRSFADDLVLIGLHGRYETSKVPETSYTPSEMDFDKWELGLVGRWQATEAFALTLSYSHFFIGSQTVRQSLYRPTSEPSLDAFNRPSPLGHYSAKAYALGLGLSADL